MAEHKSRQTGTRVGDVMSPHVMTVEADLRAEPMALLQRFRRVRHLPVVDPEGRVVGMLTRMDVLEQATFAPQKLVRVSDLMSTPIESIAAGTLVSEAARRMSGARIHALPVLDPMGELVGIVTDSDLLSAFGASRVGPPRGIEEVPVDALMTPDPIVIDTDAALGEAAGALVQASVRHLPVVDTQGKLVGVLSDRDLRRLLGETLENWSDAPAGVLDQLVEEVMTLEPVSVRSGAKLREALDALLREGVGALPVLDDKDRPIGILSYLDVLRWLQKHPGRHGEVESTHVNPMA
jgi:CBS domain-containing protein